MTFQASLHAIKVDREGETTVVLKVPQSETARMIGLMTRQQEAFDVTIPD